MIYGRHELLSALVETFLQILKSMSLCNCICNKVMRMVCYKKVLLRGTWHMFWSTIWLMRRYILIYSQINASPNFFLFFHLSCLLSFLQSLKFFCLFFFKLLHFLNNVLCNDITSFRRYIPCLSYNKIISLHQPDAVKSIFEKVNFETYQVKIVYFLEIKSNLMTYFETIMVRILFA